MTPEEFREAANIRMWRRRTAELAAVALRGRATVDDVLEHVAACGDRKAAAVLGEALAHIDAALTKIAQIQAMRNIPPRSELEPHFDEVDRLLDAAVAVQHGYLHEQERQGRIHMIAAGARN